VRNKESFVEQEMWIAISRQCDKKGIRVVRAIIREGGNVKQQESQGERRAKARKKIIH
jgi:hypothetical protein